MNSLLLVCEGNVCRSPMAEGLLQYLLPHARVDSAGLGALVGEPPDEIAVRLMRERRIDIAGHRATQINRTSVLGADLVLVMEAGQRQRLEEMYPQACGRIYRLGEFKKKDIPDPYLKPERAFRDALALIDECSRDWLLRIRKISSKASA